MVDARGGVLGQVSDRDAPHRPSTRNATRVKKGGRNYTFCPILMKNRGQNTTFSSILLKYRGQNTTFSSFLLKYRVETLQIFQRPEKGGSKRRSIYSNLHRVSTPPPGGRCSSNCNKLLSTDESEASGSRAATPSPAPPIPQVASVILG